MERQKNVACTLIADFYDFFLLASTVCAQPPQRQNDLELCVNHLLSEMTLEKKVEQLKLKQFKRVPLEPGETKNVEFTMTRAELASLGPDMRYVVNPGTNSVAVGPNSAELVEARFEIPAVDDDR